MLERIDKVARINRTDNDVTNSFKRKGDARDGKQERSAFHRMLDAATKAKKTDAPEVVVSEAYVNDCSRATHSLFYKNGLNLSFVPKGILSAYE